MVAAKKHVPIVKKRTLDPIQNPTHPSSRISDTDGTND